MNYHGVTKSQTRLSVFHFQVKSGAVTAKYRGTLIRLQEWSRRKAFLEKLTRERTQKTMASVISDD